LLEAGERRLNRLARRPFLPRPPTDDPEREERSGPAEEIADLLVLGNRLLQDRSGALDAPLGSGDETAGSRHLRKRPPAAEPHGIRFPDVEDPDRFVDPAELEERLGVVGVPPAVARLTPTERRGLLLGPAEPARGARHVSAPAGDESEDRQMVGWVQRELLFSQL